MGCWSAHMNVLQQIVAKRISSALIIQDDADWDIILKAQMLGFAHGTRAIQQTKLARGGQKAPAVPPGTPSPYGNNWDMLWIGSCAVQCETSERRFYIIPNDPTVPPVSSRTDFFHPDIADQSTMEQARIVFDTVEGSCMVGYAVTYDGARKILARLSMSPLNLPVDMAHSDRCGQQGPEDNLLCIAPYPALINSWRQTGSSARDSDIQDAGDDWHEAYSHGIVYSTMMNAQRLANGQKTCLAQWSDAQQQELDPSEFTSPRGFLYERDVQEISGTTSDPGIQLGSPNMITSAESEQDSYVHSSSTYGHQVANDYDIM